MALTIKRPVKELNSGFDNAAKHFNQMTFKGIILNNNPFDVDQLSFKDAKNVYVDDNGTLISRPPIVVDNFPTAYMVIDGIPTVAQILPVGYTLVDLFETGKIRVYVGKGSSNYYLVAMNKDSSELKPISLVTKYHLTALEQYVIAFNDVDAMVLDVNNFELGWKPLRELCEIPITKRVINQQSFDLPTNQFTESYKEEYVYSDSLLSILPEGTATVTVNQTPTNLSWTLEQANLNTEFRLLRALNVNTTESDLLSVATNSGTGITVIALAKFDHVMLSLDNGQSFERILYPNNEGFAQVASVSRDGLFFFFVARDGVYRYSIGDKAWVVIRLLDSDGVQEVLLGSGINNAAEFLNGEVFTFVLSHDMVGVPITDVYWKGPNLANVDYAADTLGYTRFSNLVYPSTKATRAARDSKSMQISVRTDAEDKLIATIVAWLPGQTSATSTLIVLLGRADLSLYHLYQISNKPYGTIDTFNILSVSPTNPLNAFRGVELIGSTIENNSWYKTKIVVGHDGAGFTPYLDYDHLQLIASNASEIGSPINLTNGYLINLMTHSVDGNAQLPKELELLERLYTVGNQNYYYMLIDGKIYTNHLVEASIVTLVYTRLSTTPYTKIPDASFAGTELYLAFGTTLQITSNLRDGSALKFNLPKINDHSFTSNINALINISTTEVAIFLINKIVIVTKVIDDVFGYRYDYNVTRLSLGVRKGDTPINTANGVFTLYPTVKGLAVMNYQPDVATTEQVVDYITKDIPSIWTKFYEVGPIKLVQMKDYVYLSNGSSTYLMVDLRGTTWWSFTSPVPIMKIVTDQVKLNFINNALYKYDDNYVIYKDLQTRPIEWYVESQPNPLNAPSHYKNLKQLIFQLEESVNTEQTILTQIKLYRKQVTLKDPEVVGFKIDSYRTMIKRFNYWKINELQWGLASDLDTSKPAQLKMNGITIKYEISEEVRS